MCGRAHPRVVGVADDPEYTHETDDPDLYANHPYRCSLPEHMRGVEGEQLSLPFNS
jgi:hypothetical protein